MTERSELEELQYERKLLVERLPNIKDPDEMARVSKWVREKDAAISKMRGLGGRR